MEAGSRRPQQRTALACGVVVNSSRATTQRSVHFHSSCGIPGWWLARLEKLQPRLAGFAARTARNRPDSIPATPAPARLRFSGGSRISPPAKSDTIPGKNNHGGTGVSGAGMGHAENWVRYVLGECWRLASFGATPSRTIGFDWKDAKASRWVGSAVGAGGGSWRLGSFGRVGGGRAWRARVRVAICRRDGTCGKIGFVLSGAAAGPGDCGGRGGRV